MRGKYRNKYREKAKGVESNKRRILNNTKVISMLFSLLLAFGIWVFITLTKTYSVIFTYKVEFHDKYNTRTEFYFPEKYINIKTQAKGVDIIMYNYFKKKNVIKIDINDINLSEYKSIIRINSNNIKPIIADFLKSPSNTFTLTPEIIKLRHNRSVMKEVVVVNKTVFKFKNSYYPIREPKILNNKVIIKGLPSEVKKIDTIYTEDIILENIDKKTVFIVPLQSLKDSLGVDFNIYNVMLEMDCLQFTEMTKEIVINPRNKDFDSIVLFPPKAKIRYRIPVRDYKKLDSFEIGIGIENEIRGKDKLKLILDTNLGNIKVIDMDPKEVEYLIYKK